jgi:hypothetical protein
MAFFGVWLEEMASRYEGSCKYIEKAIVDNQDGVVLQPRGLGRVLTTHHCGGKKKKKQLVMKCYTRP